MTTTRLLLSKPICHRPEELTERGGGWFAASGLEKLRKKPFFQLPLPSYSVERMFPPGTLYAG